MNKYLPCMGVALMSSYDVERLKRLSRQGWHVTGMAARSMLYRLERGEPHPYDYCAVVGKRPSHELLELYKESGWEPIAVEDDFQVLRSDGKAAPPYTDEATRNEAILENRRRYGSFAAVCLLVAIAILSILATMAPSLGSPLACLVAVSLLACFVVFGVCAVAFLAVCFSMKLIMARC